MSGGARVLLVSDLDPARARRRGSLLAFLREAGAAAEALALVSAPPGAEAAARLRAAGAVPGFAAPGEASAAAASLHLSRPFDLVLVANPADFAPPPGPRLILDRVAGATGPGGLALTETEGEAEGVRPAGGEAFAAPWLGAGRRRARAARPGPRPLAGLWAETPGPAEALFAAMRARGGGLQPDLLVGGPAAAALAPPPLPFPPAFAPEGTAEAVFWRAVDFALFPEGAGAEALDALARGATPLVAGPAPFGRADIWRLPLFESAPALAEYLFERGRDLRHGGLAAELRARADWTWSGWAGAAAEARARLRAALREAAGGA
ncbi:MAG: hypothetical protein ACE37J_19445 [Pikeienuella sp.]|uniref:hypothetical protein n=1 Tax=Pikeienuella sp. TaxID=2831957 RepID=UPI00391C7F35